MNLNDYKDVMRFFYQAPSPSHKLDLKTMTWKIPSSPNDNIIITQGPAPDE